MHILSSRAPLVVLAAYCLLTSSPALAQGQPPASPPQTPAGEPDTKDEAEAGTDEEISDEEVNAELEQQSAAISKAAPKGKGVVWGEIRDASEHDTLPEAQVTVPGTKFKTVADFDGRYRLELPPGTYSVRVFYELHHTTVLKGVVVQEGAVQRVDVELFPDEAQVDTVEVVAEVDRSSLEGQMLTRRKAATVGDGVGRAEISRTPAANAAQAAQRVVGATIVGERFVYVRGLGERYTNALLNGAPLPSPEPDRAAIPLDLFPALILESINIVKTFTPDMPADFAGGSVQIETRELPSKPLAQISAGLGYDTNTTFQQRLSHRGSNTDWLGFDGGTRTLPDAFPKYVLVPGEPKPGGGTITNDDLLNSGRLINSSMDPTTPTSPPNYSVSTVLGRGFDLGGEKRFGALASLNYGRSYKKRDGISIYQYRPDVDANGNEIQSKSLSLKQEYGVDKVNWGALGSLSFWPNRRHRFTLTGIHTQLADASAQYTEGIYESRGAAVASVDLRYVSRALNVLQLRGEHDFPDMNHAELRWYGSYSVAARAEPNKRDTAYQYNEGQAAWNSLSTPENGAHFYADQDEKTYGAGIDFTQPILKKEPDDLKLKSGGLITMKKRNFAARRFNYDKMRGAPNTLFTCAGVEYSYECPVPLYQWGNIGTVLNFSESTQVEDAYKAELDVYAAYLMLDANVLPDLRVVGGARIERTDQSIDPYSQFTGGMAPAGAELKSTDWLPALALTYSATSKVKVRAGVSRTLARPQIRELSPFVFADYFGAYPIAGNPKLKLTYIRNGDLRFEYYPTGREVMAFSFFYKVFTDPIEPYIFPSGTPGLITYQNAKGATLVGIELEARKDLGFVAEALRDFSFIGNLTIARSQIQLQETGLQNSTNTSRALVNQAPYVVNLSLDYDNRKVGFSARLLYNLIGPRIVQVGVGGLDDTYEQSRHLLDATVAKDFGEHLQVKLVGTNLLDAPVRFTVGKENSNDKLTLRYKDGRVFTAVGSYKF